MYTSEAILTFLREEGYTQGMKSSKVDCNEVENLLKQNYERMSWVSARVVGTRILIQVKENYGELEIKKPDTKEMDLVAPYDGKVVSIITRDGVPMVKVGANVKKGQILISGEIPIKDDSGEIINYRYIRADAMVVLERNLSYTDTIERVETKKVYTGRTNCQYVVQVGDIALKLRGLLNSYEHSEQLFYEHQWKILGDFYLPIYTNQWVQREYKIIHSTQTKDELKRKLTKNLCFFIQNLEKKT
ncbi:Stage IV sporulation protein [Lachnospiraceae bacterium TWA4]|nr:Stage IV sporulation protein [Lachnospiraceae bacterium TWA4]